MMTQKNRVGIGRAAILVLIVLAVFTPAMSIGEVYQKDSMQAGINASSNQTDMLSNVNSNQTDMQVNVSSNQTEMREVNITEQKKVTPASTPATSGVEVHSGDSIQAAINAALPGETIIVHDGTYKENLVVNRSDIVIRSANGSAVTIISSNQMETHVVNITNQTNVTLQGFTIRDAEGILTGVAGIYMDTTENCTISDIGVTDIYAAGEGNDAWGIYQWFSENNTFDSISYGRGVAD